MSLRLRAWPNGLSEFEMFGVRGQGADLGQSPEATVQSASQTVLAAILFLLSRPCEKVRGAAPEITCS